MPELLRYHSDRRRLSFGRHSLQTRDGDFKFVVRCMLSHLNRLDIFDGNSSDISKMLSDKGGICGCKLPAKTVFMSSGNAITVRLQTTRDRTTHGELELVLTSVKNEFFHRADCSGQFKCKTSGECVDKNLICDGKAECQDKSDESNCKMHNLTCFDMFTCMNGQCINKNGVCDGRD
ncbi:suppressor of tumorigenicity 14 protein-like [Dreissena polymorpha]|uniref:Uncharacterized protein n=1 Tax=Dreissena polymorpha TaxID=45954 RepID=A0A9D4IDA2_DREPO|nr:suppressor of tumorigenicity 14 protein-like [Dreissena polymorpha]KAH3769640.1 hypothetical protein DPMN_170913 [Dreissena polymorpha]